MVVPTDEFRLADSHHHPLVTAEEHEAGTFHSTRQLSLQPRIKLFSFIVCQPLTPSFSALLLFYLFFCFVCHIVLPALCIPCRHSFTPLFHFICRVVRGNCPQNFSMDALASYVHEGLQKLLSYDPSAVAAGNAAILDALKQPGSCLCFLVHSLYRLIIIPCLL